MVLKILPQSTAYGERSEVYTHLSIFVKSSVHIDLMNSWFENQTFKVIAYEGWEREYFLEKAEHFLIMKLTWGDKDFHINIPVNDDSPFMPLYAQWRRKKDEAEKRFQRSLKAQRMAQQS